MEGDGTEHRGMGHKVREIQMVLTSNCSEVFAHHFCALQASFFKLLLGSGIRGSFSNLVIPRLKISTSDNITEIMIVL